MAKTWLIGVAITVGLLAGYLLLWPVSISPQRWTPPTAPALTGEYAANDALAAVTRIDVGLGPESVAVSPAGVVACGLEEGEIVRWSPEANTVEQLAVIDGRPLGMEIDAAGNLIVCDLYGRLLSISDVGVVDELATELGGERLGLVNDLDIAQDGTVFFSESSAETTDTVRDLLEHRPNGRLLTYNIGSGEIDVLLDGLYYANGVALSADESFVLVVETTRYRVRRLWLSGPRSGEDEVFIDNLPGFPDGISCDNEGTFWLALMNPRNGFVDWALARPWVRKIPARLPLTWFAGAAPRYGFVLGVGEDGCILYNLQDPSGDFYAGISSVVRSGNLLYLGSLLEEAIGRVAVP